MRVRDVMVGTPAYCKPEMNLAEAVEILWNRNCGILPVVGSDGKVKGVITDRDICVALGTRDQKASELTVGDAMTQRVVSCYEDEDIRSAVNSIRREGVRRLPVLGSDGTLKGLLSVDDLVRHSSESTQTSELPYDLVLTALRDIYTRQLPRIVQAQTARA